MSKYKCTDPGCFNQCEVGFYQSGEAPSKCLFTGKEQSREPVEPEQFGKSEQLPEPQTEPSNHVEVFMGFKVPKHSNLDSSVEDFNRGGETFACVEVCDVTNKNIRCEDTFFFSTHHFL